MKESRNTCYMAQTTDVFFPQDTFLGMVGGWVGGEWPTYCTGSAAMSLKLISFCKPQLNTGHLGEIIYISYSLGALCVTDPRTESQYWR